MSAKTVGKKTMQDVWNYFANVSKKPNHYVNGTWGWKDAQGRYQGDCICTIKACGWGVDDDITSSNKYDYIAKNKATMPDVSISSFYNNSTVKSTDMSKIPTDKFSFVYIGSGHIGIYNPSTKQTYEMCAGGVMGIRLMALNGNTYWKEWSTGSPYFSDSVVDNAIKTHTTHNVTTKAFVYDGVDYSPIFDAKWYANNHKDALNKCGYNENKLFDYFITEGTKVANRHMSCSTFDPDAYAGRNIKIGGSDLIKAFGRNVLNYYKHYVQFGMKEYTSGANKTRIGTYDTTYSKVGADYFLDKKATLTVSSYPNYTNGMFYKVRKTFDGKESIGSYSIFKNAFNAWNTNKNSDYHLYDATGKQLD